MYLEKIEIAGFKSFAERVGLEFLPGISGVVGPNGSGKSNLADAIRWVLGEQSTKLLRSKKAEDVIFVGTKEKGRLSLAEVSLYLNNEDKRAPLDYEKVILSRRVYRSGASEYFINKNHVRLLDIQQLLAKAGFGQKTYSVIGQGMIDTLLKASPKELKEIFYDACGVRQFQIKRNLARNKLALAKENLLRGGDLIREIAPRLKSLSRQVEKAAKKNELEKEKATLFDRYYSSLYCSLLKQKEAIEKKISAAQAKEKDFLTEIARIEKAIERYENQSLTNSLNEKLNTELTALESKRGVKNQELAILRGKLAFEQEKANSLSSTGLKKQKEALENELAMLEKKSASIRKILEGANQKITILTSKQEAIKKKILQTKIELERSKQLKQKSFLSFEQIEKELEAALGATQKLIKEAAAAKTPMAWEKACAAMTEQEKQLMTLLKKVKNRGGLAEEKIITKLQEDLSDFFEKRETLARVLNEHHLNSAALKGEFEALKQSGSLKKLELKNVLADLKEAENQGRATGLVGVYLKQEKEILGEINELQKKGQVLRVKIEAEKQAENAKRRRIFEFEKNYRAKQAALNNLRNNLRSLEIKLAGLFNNEKLLLAEISDDVSEAKLGEALLHLRAKNSSLSQEDEEQFGRRIKTLRKQLFYLADVDAAIIKEHQETAVRFDFLSKQKEDLEKTSEKLRDIISELDRKIERQFNLSFEVINHKFQKYFSVLFDGGKARLQKKVFAPDRLGPEVGLASEEPADFKPNSAEKKLVSRETVIEIKANPPGKKLSDLSMLSGGERALTSIALLMAIIESNPPPFIVLDEVDAALDESNSRRFAKIILAASKKSQVLAITHNRATMSEAKLLYGVTMRENGVSKILSVKLEEAEKFRQRKGVKS